mgnify:CR=1 FL=1
MCICVCIVANGSKAARTSERANGRTSERANGRTGERANGRTSERANGRTGERANTRTGERANERTSERANGRTRERANERTSERTNGAFVRSVVRLFGESRPQDHETTGLRDDETARRRKNTVFLSRSQAFSAVLSSAWQCVAVRGAWCQSGADTTLGEFGGDGLY